MHKYSFWDYDMAGRSRSRLAFLLLFFIGFGSACQAPTAGSPTAAPIPSHRSFYHWQTEFSLTAQEQTWLDSMQIDQIYVKFFDLDWDPAYKDVVPLATVQLDTLGLKDRKVIPTIFITNRSMLNLPEEEIPILARQMANKIDQLYQGVGQPLQEVQMDCDWTARSRPNYFHLLESLQMIYVERGVTLSTTIRLHQLRNPEQTGVPPADRGVLMFYNMGDLSDWQEPNSILNLEKAAAYLPDGINYPIQLDLALPLFRWGVLFREGRMIKLINEPDVNALQVRAKYRELSPNRFEVLESTYWNGFYLYRGDRLRIESVSIKALQGALDLVRSQYPQGAQNLIWYHLDTAVVKRYNWRMLMELEQKN